MDFLKSLWPNSSSNVITIPQHMEGEFEDDLDLKVKALTYLFKRLDIENLPAFVNDGNGIYNFGDKSVGNEKLDAIYNKIELERQLVQDEHRILIDWFKNRFRSVCILSGQPPSDFEHHLSKNFKFVILRAEASDEVYINTLVNSDIYMEHPLDVATKRQIMVDVLQSQRQLRPSYKKCFNKNDRASIVLQYIRRISEVVQIERIYKASLLTKLESFKSSKLGQIKENIDEFSETSYDDNDEENNGVRLFPSSVMRSSRSRSPVRRYSNDTKSPLSPVKLNTPPQLLPPSSQEYKSPSSSPIRSSISPSSTRTTLRSRSASPQKNTLKKKASMTILKMDKTLASSEPVDAMVDDEWISKEEMANLQTQAEQAVLFRVERERKVLRAK